MLRTHVYFEQSEVRKDVFSKSLRRLGLFTCARCSRWGRRQKDGSNFARICHNDSKLIQNNKKKDKLSLQREKPWRWQMEKISLMTQNVSKMTQNWPKNGSEMIQSGLKLVGPADGGLEKNPPRVRRWEESRCGTTTDDKKMFYRQHQLEGETLSSPYAR